MMQRVLILALLIVSSTAGQTALSSDQTIAVFKDVQFNYDRSLTDGTQRDGLRVLRFGQEVEATVELPRPPSSQRDARRIVATVIVEPVVVETDDKLRPGDPWTRLGSVRIVLPNSRSDLPSEIELMRFITGFGGAGEFSQDVTALAPLLDGQTTFRLSISTYNNPGWNASLSIRYSSEDVGYRRPAWAQSIFTAEQVTSENDLLRATISIPAGLARPRLHVLSTGHASDGTGGDEFISRTHVLKVDGKEVARWRPWAERGGAQRSVNPTSGRMTIDGRELWSSDLDRSGWHPGLIVEPLLIPIPELTPGRHTIELTILDIRPRDDSGLGYWRTSVTAVADEPWPEMSGSPE